MVNFLFLSDIIRKLSFGLLIFDRYRGQEHFRILPEKIEHGTYEGFVDGIKVSPRFKSGIFNDVIINKIDRKLILTAYKLQKIWGTPDGMSSPPTGMKKSRWDEIKLTYDIGAREDNYLLFIDEVKNILEVITEIEEKKYFSYQNKTEIFNRMLENKYDRCFIDNTFIAGTGAICPKCRDVISSAFLITIPNRQVGKIDFDIYYDRFQAFINKLKKFNSSTEEKDWK